MATFILKEDGNYLLQETGDKLILNLGTSLSASPSSSTSPSSSISASISPSPSSSESLSPSATQSASPSLSVSASQSPSPSPGFTDYTKGNEDNLPTTDNDLETQYTEQDEIDVSTRNNVYVGQTGLLQYMLHQYKLFIGNEEFVQLEWEGKSTLAPNLSPVYMQIFNRNTGVWDTLAYDDCAVEDINFELTGKVADLTNYKDSRNIISCRIYQLAI